MHKTALEDNKLLTLGNKSERNFILPSVSLNLCHYVNKFKTLTPIFNGIELYHTNSTKYLVL